MGPRHWKAVFPWYSHCWCLQRIFKWTTEKETQHTSQQNKTQGVFSLIQIILFIKRNDQFLLNILWCHEYFGGADKETVAVQNQYILYLWHSIVNISTASHYQSCSKIDWRHLQGSSGINHDPLSCLDTWISQMNVATTKSTEPSLSPLLFTFFIEQSFTRG